MTVIDLDKSEFETLRRRAMRLEFFTVGWNSLEAVVALVAGGLTSSIALVGFGLDSVIEAVSGLTLLWRFEQKHLGEQDAESHALKVDSANPSCVLNPAPYSRTETYLLARPSFRTQWEEKVSWRNREGIRCPRGLTPPENSVRIRTRWNP